MSLITMCGSCFKLIGCCCCFFVLLLVTLGLVASYFYAVYVPQVPSYEVEKLEVRAFDMQPDSILNTEILITVRAANPNSNIGLIYGQNGVVNVVFNDSDVLCWGRPPHFHQGHKNVTTITVYMVGKGPVGPGLQAAFADNQKSHRPVPLVVKAVMPMRIVLEEVPLREFTVYVNSSLLVDNLAPNKTATIVSSDTTYHFEL